MHLAHTTRVISSLSLSLVVSLWRPQQPRRGEKRGFGNGEKDRRGRTERVVEDGDARWADALETNNLERLDLPLVDVSPPS